MAHNLFLHKQKKLYGWDELVKIKDEIFSSNLLLTCHYHYSCHVYLLIKWKMFNNLNNIYFWQILINYKLKKCTKFFLALYNNAWATWLN